MAAQQIPVLCARCGGAAVPADDGALHCPFCGHDDRLPADQLGRALELKRRLASAAASAAQLRGMESGLAHVFEDRWAFVRVTGPWLLIAPVILAYSLVSAWPFIEKAPPGFRAGMIINALIGPMFIAGILIAIAVALAVGRFSYRRKVRPLMYARTPRAPGLPARCRACGGDLPDGRGPYLVCSFCSTHNLVTPEIQAHSAAALEAEQRFHRDRANQVIAKTSRSSIHMSRTMVIGVVVTYAMLIGLAALAGEMFPK
jgi:hypothetical protein